MYLVCSRTSRKSEEAAKHEGAYPNENQLEVRPSLDSLLGLRNVVSTDSCIQASVSHANTALVPRRGAKVVGLNQGDLCLHYVGCLSHRDTGQLPLQPSKHQ